jgi:hypothetical protein
VPAANVGAVVPPDADIGCQPMAIKRLIGVQKRGRVHHPTSIQYVYTACYRTRAAAAAVSYRLAMTLLEHALPCTEPSVTQPLNEIMQGASMLYTATHKPDKALVLVHHRHH